MAKSSFDAFYMRQYRANHPDRVKQWELNAARNKLEKSGCYVVTSVPAEKKDLTEMTDNELREALEEHRRKNRESCYKWRNKNYDRFLAYQREYRKKHKKARDLKAEIDRRHGNGE